MVHSAAIWVYRALELIRAYACVKTPLDVVVGTNFTPVYFQTVAFIGVFPTRGRCFLRR